MNFKEKIPRSVGKVITWRIILSIQYFIIGYVTTGSIASALGLVGITTVVNSCIYYLHERAWNKSDWGKQVLE
jgi:uncharacterized membrane protein